MAYFITRTAPLVSVLGLLAGCGSSPGSGAAGELGQGTFEYVCVNDGDAKCSMTSNIDEFDVHDLGSPKALPQGVAVGSIFGLRYAGRVRDDGDELLVQVLAASHDDELSPEIFSIAEPAEAAFLAVDSKGRSIDFVVVPAVEATELSVWSEEVELSDLVLSVGDTAGLTVVPRSSDGDLLAGAIPYLWTSSQGSIFSLNDGSTEVRNEGDCEITAEGQGEAELRIVSGNLVVRVNVEVVP